MESKMNIPKTLRVGYQKREDTYTKKLAYVIYIDEKGKVRKEASWESWRDKKMGSDDIENVPTSGFVMNKKVGDYKSDWNHRMAHIRIYDPRGFEFEIGVENLLYILEECSSIKGKGLEGEFVYAWSGTDLVLLPTTAQEYVTSRKFTDMKSMKVGKADMKAGCVYITKDMRNVLYLGHEEVFELDTNYGDGGSYTRAYNHKSIGKKHVFVNIDAKKKNEWSEPEKYWYQDGFTKLASKVSDVISTDFADEYDTWKKSLDGNQCKEVKVVPTVITKEMLTKKNFYSLSVVQKTPELDNKYNHFCINQDYSDKEKFTIEKQSIFTINGLTVSTTSVDRSYGWSRTSGTKVTMDQLIGQTYHKIFLVNDHNKKIEITY